MRHNLRFSHGAVRKPGQKRAEEGSGGPTHTHTRKRTSAHTHTEHTHTHTGGTHTHTHTHNVRTQETPVACVTHLPLDGAIQEVLSYATSCLRGPSVFEAHCESSLSPAFCSRVQ